MLNNKDIQKIKDAILSTFELRFNSVDERLNELGISVKNLQQKVMGIQQKVDNLEQKIDLQHQEFLEFKNNVTNFQEYAKESFEIIRYRVEDTYRENRSKIGNMEENLATLSRALSTFATPK